MLMNNFRKKIMFNVWNFSSQLCLDTGHMYQLIHTCIKAYAVLTILNISQNKNVLCANSTVFTSFHYSFHQNSQIHKNRGGGTDSGSYDKFYPDTFASACSK